MAGEAETGTAAAARGECFTWNNFTAGGEMTDRATDRSKRPDNFYEVLDQIQEEDGETRLTASFTPNNGIRVGISDAPDDPFWHEFDFTPEQAELIGQALVRWAQRSRAEGEMVRCWRYMP